ncbi:Uncharacterised protein [Vibrio cholerae]|nr:Uncharacterised protein [Vibrio cholerae]CSB16447.1 Uncharacterised protein [Vibrio cholerae]CSB22941.1 Uncharacterised protein [Vibrio cholerae]CSB27637.1 Uncharacterised protein [Vibrio cholerae]CSB38738.1 Uncharacterised protein [Vibrio cholerae]
MRLVKLFLQWLPKGLRWFFYCNRWHRYLSNYLHHWKWYDLPALLVYCLVVFRQWYKAVLIDCKASGD